MNNNRNRITIAAALSHPNGSYMGNLCWAGALPAAAQDEMPIALSKIRARGYFASPFPECDGISFGSGGNDIYEADKALHDFRICFPFLSLDPLKPGKSLNMTLAELAEGRTIKCCYLIPVEGLRLNSLIQLGQTELHPPVDGVEILLSDHRWKMLCDIPGSDIDPAWAPGSGTLGTAKLLAHPLIERRIEIPLNLLYEAKDSIRGAERLLRFLIEDSDQSLDPIRFENCHYNRLEFLPAKPGWIGDTALAYVIPDAPSILEWLVEAKPYVLRVSNNWLGLELDAGTLTAMAVILAELVDDPRKNPIELSVKSALRALNKAFYLVDLEASFLHLVYATDALCEPGRLKGDRHRIWVSAVASGGNAERFKKFLTDYSVHYGVRNDIVHAGETFASLGLRGEDQCQFMLQVLASCLIMIVREGFTTQREIVTFVSNLLATDPFEDTIRAMGSTHLTTPTTLDKEFKKHVDSYHPHPTSRNF